MKFNINNATKMNAEIVDYIFKILEENHVTDIVNMEKNFTHITTAIQDSLIEHTGYELVLDICGVSIYLDYQLDTVIDRFLDSYEDISQKNDFEWDFLEQSHTPIVWFNYKDGAYSVTLSESTMGVMEGWTEEIISVRELKKEIHTAKFGYYNYVKDNLSHVFPEYVKYLELSF